MIASPASGSSKVHDVEQHAILARPGRGDLRHPARDALGEIADARRHPATDLFATELMRNFDDGGG